jgi:hypothetical protein
MLAVMCYYSKLTDRGAFPERRRRSIRRVNERLEAAFHAFRACHGKREATEENNVKWSGGKLYQIPPRYFTSFVEFFENRELQDREEMVMIFETSVNEYK